MPMPFIDSKAPPVPPMSAAPSSSLKRSFDDAQYGWLDRPSGGPAPHPQSQSSSPYPHNGAYLQHQPSMPGDSHTPELEGFGQPHEEMGDSSRRIVKKRRLFVRSASPSPADHREPHPDRNDGFSRSPPSHISLPPTPGNDPKPPHEYSRINNLLHTLHTMHAIRQLPMSPGSSGSGAGSLSGEATSAQAGRGEYLHLEDAPVGGDGKEDVRRTYESTNRILGSLALERQKRLGEQHAYIPRDSQDEESHDLLQVQGGGAGAHGADDNGSAESDDLSVIYDSDMEL